MLCKHLGAVIISAIVLSALTQQGHAQKAPQSAQEQAAVSPSAPLMNDRLQSMLDAFAKSATHDQTQQVAGAIMASPALTQQLDDLADTGKLKGIELRPPVHTDTSPFPNTIDHGVIVLTREFLTQNATKRLFDVVIKDEILPNNLVFALGGLTFHLQNEDAVAAAMAKPGLDEATFLKTHMDDDAGSFIQGWNDVIDAAINENGNKPLTIPQQGMLDLNLRYRAVLEDGGKNTIVNAPSGKIEPTAQNVAAIEEILRHTQLLDFGAPMGP